MTISKKKNVVPYMVHLEPLQIKELKKASKADDRSISAIVRDAIRARLSGDSNPWRGGFIDGLNRAYQVAQNAPGAQMNFPDGKSFAVKVCEGLEDLIEKA